LTRSIQLKLSLYSAAVYMATFQHTTKSCSI